jgi:eukaryotic-like serine/threonine-protein kinase
MLMEGDPNLETADYHPPATRTASAHPGPLPTSFAAARYQVVRLLGEGGQKQVFLARDTRLRRDVVIALLKTQQLEPQSIARLQREAQAMAQLGDHPNIVTVYDLGEEGGRPYIVSQYIDGGSVADLLKGAEKRRLPLEQCVRIAEQICHALAYAHARGIVHRDLKPGNVWMTREGAAKLGDFGLALDPHFSRLTLRGTLLGTVAYMSPEQAVGRKAQPQTDLYSLGAMLYEMVTGRPPFLGDQLVGIISQHINTPPVAPSWHNPELPQALENLILQLLAKTPEERPQSAAAVQKALAAIASSSSVLAPRVAPQDAKSLARLAAGIFVGRTQEITTLRARLNDVVSGQGRLVMVVGEPGSGKTRITEQLVTFARLLGSQVLIGGCYEGEGAPAFWPWMQIIRAYAQERRTEPLASAMGQGAADIAQLVSEVRERLPNLPAPPSLEPEQARFRLFDSITAFLKSAAKEQPLVLVLDDLHWADKPSLLLLEFLTRELRDARLLVIGTYRDIELGRQHPLTQTLGELARQGLTERILLPGLTRPDVARFIEMTAGVETPEELVEAVYKKTEGNPFFVTEVVRLLVSDGRLQRPGEAASWNIRIPEGVRDVIGRRLDHLSELCNRVLTHAAVIGREFSLEALEALAEIPSDRLLELLEEAVAARVISEMPRAAGSYCFSHALIRETLYDRLSAARRLRLHRRVGEVLESIHQSRLEPHLDELAYHFIQAAPGGQVEKALDYAVRAAQRATSLLAYEGAAGHYERALQALELKEPPDEQCRSELLLALGDAQTRAGNTVKARDTFQLAADVARRVGLAEHFARAALGIGAGAVMGTRYGEVDELQVRLLEEALRVLGENESAHRVRLLAQLCLALYHSVERRVRLSQEAVEMARRVASKPGLLAALFSRSIALEGFEKAEERLAVATEIVQVAEEIGEKEMALRGHYRRLRELLELGDVPAVEEELKTYARLADELRQPRYLWLAPFYKSTFALLEGRFEDCERLVRQALTIGQRAQDPNAILFFNTEMVTLRRLQGRFEEVEAEVKNFVLRYPSIAGWRASLACIYSGMGRRSQAREEFERLAQNDFAGLPRDGAWVVGIALLAQVCAFLHDAQRAAPLYGLLLPFAGHNVIIGAAAVFYGPVSRHLGLLATTMSHWEEAAGHFEDALATSARLGARPFTAFSQHEYAAMLLARRQPEDREKAFSFLQQALATANELGMKGLAKDVEALRKGI